MAALSWLFATLITLGCVGLAIAAGTALALVAMWSEPRIRLPLSIEPATFDSIRHVATRDWLRTYTMVLESLGFLPRPIYLVPSGLRAGRVAFAWFSRAEGRTLCLLTCSPVGHSVAFMDGPGAGRLETTTELIPLSLRGRDDPVAREVRADQTDPAALLRSHEELRSAAEAVEPGEPVSDEALREALVESYVRVLAIDEQSRRRLRVGSGSSPTLRGRLAAARRRLGRHVEELALRVERG